MTDIHSQNKQFIGRFRAALYDCNADTLQADLTDFFASDAIIHLAHPLGDMTGPTALFEGVYRPLLTAMPDLERRDYIVVAGGDKVHNWVGCCGHYMGVFENHWLDIPPTKHLTYMRYHEFFRIENEQIVEMQAIWDIPSVMIQANAWPLSPSLAVNIMSPSPATNDGIVTAPYDETQAEASVDLVRNMLTDMGKHPKNSDPTVMQLDNYWHPKMTWYGPSGIGAMRLKAGFRRWHQIPFLKALPDRHGADSESAVFFGDHNYVGTTGWPNMAMTVSGSGWLGIAPSDKAITMRSLDFWRIEEGLLRENWVLVDLLHVYDQLGVDVFERMRELTVARQPL